MSNLEWHNDQSIGEKAIRDYEERRKDDEGKAALADELRQLLSVFIDATLLKGHTITKEDWNRACLLCGRYCYPYVQEEKQND